MVQTDPSSSFLDYRIKTSKDSAQYSQCLKLEGTAHQECSKYQVKEVVVQTKRSLLTKASVPTNKFFWTTTVRPHFTKSNWTESQVPKTTITWETRSTELITSFRRIWLPLSSTDIKSQVFQVVYHPTLCRRDSSMESRLSCWRSNTRFSSLKCSRNDWRSRRGWHSRASMTRMKLSLTLMGTRNLRSTST